MNVICARKAALPSLLSTGALGFSYFERSGLAGTGRIALNWPDELKAASYAPPLPVWDFVLLSLAVLAADFHCPRNTSPDGWTRQLSVTASLNQPDVWSPHAAKIEQMLRVLTGDFWTFQFLGDGPPPPHGRRKRCNRDCVALLSGGLDSFIGGIDLVTAGRLPVFVSQVAVGDSERQAHFAAELGGGDYHQHWNHSVILDGRPHEPSTRARSLGFFAEGVLASTLLDTESVDLYVAENGFMSLNPPLLPGRIGSFSTRTTHPVFMRMLQELLSSVGIPVQLKLPYRFATKGEMLIGCTDQDLLRRLASTTTSCGRFNHYNRTHCGRCVPCIVRRAAFLKWNPAADETRYVFGSLGTSEKKSSDPDDVVAVACAVLQARDEGIERFLGAATSFARGQERQDYENMTQRGLAEIEGLLVQQSIL